MVKVDETLTRKVADLARLDLTDAEVTTFTSQLGDILKYVEQLSEVDISRGEGGRPVEPMTHPFDLRTPMRDDVVVPSLQDAQGQPKMLQPAPETVEGGFKVPQIL